MKARTLSALLLMLIGLAGCSSGGKTFLYTTGPGTPEIFQFQIRSDGSLSALNPGNSPAGTGPVSVVIHPSNDFAYIANFTGNTVTLLSVNRGNGQLSVPTTTVVVPPPTPPNIFNTGTGPIAIAVSPAGTFLYVLNQGSSNISAFTVDPTTGNLGTVMGSPFATPASPRSIAISTNGNFLYVANPTLGTVSAFAVDSHGVLTASGTFAAGTSPTFVMVEPSGHFVYVADSTGNAVLGFSIGSGGALTPVSGSPFAVSSQPVAITTTPGGAFLYVANQGSSNVSAFVIDAKTGSLGAVSGSPFPTGGRGPTFLAATGALLYVTDQITDDLAAFTIGTNGALTRVNGSPFNVATQPVWVTVANP